MESLSVRKVSELKSLQELNLSPEVAVVLQEYSINNLVLFARRHELCEALLRARGKYYSEETVSDDVLATEKSLCEKCSNELESALDEAGFFRNDFGRYTVSLNIMAFLRILTSINYDDSFFDQHENANREWKSFSNEEYESFEGLSNIQVRAFRSILRGVLSDNQYDVISLRMGFDNGLCSTREEIADDYMMTEDQIKDYEKTTFHLMKKVINAGVLKRMYRNYVEPEVQGLVEI